MTRTLVLCSSMPEARHYAAQARKRGDYVMGSSSLLHDSSADQYNTWEFLPDIYEDRFLPCLLDMLNRNTINQIYCAHNVVWQKLNHLKKEGKFKATLLGTRPMEEKQHMVKQWLQKADSACSWMRAVSSPQSLRAFQVAAILRQAELTYGESGEDKILSMMALFDNLPAGDIIEIGSLWGKTAVVLAMLARQHQIGSVLCIDPWLVDASIQKDSPEIMRAATRSIDWDGVFTGFTLFTAAVAQPGHFNYLRLPSHQAGAYYKKQRSVTSDEFGTTRYCGKIALIHIDGNHDFDCVKLDYDTWRPHMQPGGWVVLDDYIWQHGNGPHCLGNSVLQHENASILRSFTSGKALFLQLA